MTVPAEVDVLVVGGGPVGLATALALDHHGVSSLVIERRAADAVLHPTANHLGVRAVELLRRWGLEDEVRTHCFPPDHPDHRWWMTRLDGHVLWDLARPANQEPVDLPWSPCRELWAPKPGFDPILGAAVRDRARAQVVHECELVELRSGAEPAATSATAVLRGRSGEHIVRAQVLIACDGAASTTRHAAGIDLLGPVQLPVTLQSVWFTSPQLLEHLPPGTQWAIVEPTGMLINIDGRGELRLHVATFDREAPLTPAEGAAMVRDAAGDASLELEVHSCLAWRLGVSVADRWRVGRVLLAGDAAKTTTPYGGLGMNYGLVDADALSWRVAALLGGWGDDALLDDYAWERRTASRHLLGYQGAALDAEPPTLRSPLAPPPAPPHLCDDGPIGDAARATYAAVLATHQEGHYDNVGVDLDQRVVGSPGVVDAAGDEPLWTLRTYVQHARAGHRAPHLRLPDARSSIDAYGRTVAVVGVDRSTSDLLVHVLHAAGIPTTALDAPDVAAAYGKRLTVVRPDGMIAWSGDEAPDDPGPLVAALTGRARAG